MDSAYNLLKTSQSVSPSLTGADVLLYLLGYMAVYLIIFPVGIFLMTRVVRKEFINEPNAPVEGQQQSSNPILGLAVSIFPMIVAFHFTIWQAASSPETQLFLAIGTLILLPIILIYTAWSYWVFWGKVQADVGYLLMAACLG